MLIATFNVNSIRQRIEHLTRWLKSREPDIVCLQELKCLDEAFPREEIEALGYQVETFGQKTFNGVAILSRHGIEIEQRGLPGFPDEQARYIEGVVSLPQGMDWVPCCESRASISPTAIPWAARNSNTSAPSWRPSRPMRKTCWRSRSRSSSLAITMSFPRRMMPASRELDGDALFQPESRADFRRLCALGFTEAVRATSDNPRLYSFWDYQAGAWQRDNGIRIDHLLLSPRAADRLMETGIDREMRAEEKPSDHVPVWCRLRD